jgi:hypothetical protein
MHIVPWVTAAAHVAFSTPSPFAPGVSKDQRPRNLVPEFDLATPIRWLRFVHRRHYRCEAERPLAGASWKSIVSELDDEFGTFYRS